MTESSSGFHEDSATSYALALTRPIDRYRAKSAARSSSTSSAIQSQARPSANAKP